MPLYKESFKRTLHHLRYEPAISFESLSSLRARNHGLSLAPETETIHEANSSSEFTDTHTSESPLTLIGQDSQPKTHGVSLAPNSALCRAPKKLRHVGTEGACRLLGIFHGFHPVGECKISGQG